MKSLRGITKTGVFIGAALIFITSTSVYVFSSDSNSKETQLSGSELYPVNEYGETYGKVIYHEEEPDLIAAYGIDGTYGYVKATDLSPNPSTPEEALELQKNRSEETLIPLYDKDGRTVIGKFELKNG